MQKLPFSAAALTSASLPIEDDVHQVFLEKAVGRLEDTGVGAFGEDDGAAGGFQSVKQFCKHVITSKICAAFRRFYLCLSYNNYPPNATVFCKNAQQNGAQAVYFRARQRIPSNFSANSVIANVLSSLQYSRYAASNAAASGVSVAPPPCLPPVVE